MLEALNFLLADRKERRVYYPNSYYSPAQAVEDLLEKGLSQAAIDAASSGKTIYAGDVCSGVQELSRIFYEMNDENMIDKVSNIVYMCSMSVKNPEDFRPYEPEQILCSMGYGALHRELKNSALKILQYLEALVIHEVRDLSRPKDSLQIAMLIGYLGAAAIDFGALDVANEALKKLFRFEEYYVEKYGELPELNHMSLLTRIHSDRRRLWSRDEPCLDPQVRGWLYRLSAGKINTHEKLLSDEAIDQFYTMYLANLLPKGF